jgi:hypothetical protein
MTIYKIIIPNNIKNSKSIEMLYEFQQEVGFDLCDVAGVEISDCEQFEIVYANLDLFQANIFKNIVISNGFACEVEECTNEFLESLLNSNERYKDFECVISGLGDLYVENVSKDLVLDKINLLGKTSLLDVDYLILNS